MNKKLATVLMAGTAMAMAACTSSHPSSTSSKSASSVTSGVSANAGSTSGAGKSAPVKPGGTIPTSVANDPKVRNQATLDQAQCKAAPGGWQAGGTANNPGKTATTFTITVFFTTDHATVLSSKATTVKVAAGKTEKWNVTSKFTAPKTVLCVLRGVSTSP